MGDYYLVKTDRLEIIGRHVGRSPSDDKQIPGFAALGGVVITGSLVGGQTITIPALDYATLRDNYESIQHHPSLFVQEGAPPLPLNCPPYPQWNATCYAKTEMRSECTWMKWNGTELADGTKGAGCGQYNTFSKGVLVEHGKGKLVFDLLTGAETVREHWSTYTITLLDGVKIIVNQGKTQNLYISTPCKSILSSDGVIAGHCGDFNGDFENDKIENYNCPMLVGDCQESTSATEHLGNYGPDCGVLPRHDKCTDMMHQEFEPICARIFPTATQPAAQVDCVTDCCVDRQECVDKDFEDQFAHCSMTGDPHIKTFGAEGINSHVYFPHGDFYAFKSPQLTVQVRYSSVRSDFKAQVFGVALTGPLVGKMLPGGAYPVLEVPMLTSGAALRLDQNTAIAGNCTTDCTVETDYWKATYGKGFKVGMWWDEDFVIQQLADGHAAFLKNESSGELVKVVKKKRKTVTIDLHHNDMSLAKLVVNNGKRQNIMLEVRSVLLDTSFTGELQGHCLNEQADKCDGSDKVPDGESLFKDPHPSPSIECPMEDPCPELREYEAVCQNEHNGTHPTVTCESALKGLLAACAIDCCQAGKCPVEDDGLGDDA